MPTSAQRPDKQSNPHSLISSRAVLHLVSAIGRGEIDALVLPTPQGERVFTQWSVEQPYRVLVEAMTEGALTMTVEGTILYCNSAFAEMIGSSLEKVIGSCLSDLVMPADRAKLICLLDQGCCVPTRAELRLNSQSRTVPVYVSAQPLPDSAGNRICAVVTNLTELDEARQAQRHLAAIVETSADAIMSTTPAGLVSSWNRGAEHLLGYSAAEMLGLSVLNTIPVDRCAGFMLLLDQVKSGQSEHNFEMEQLRKDGTRIDVVVTLSPIRDRQGQVVAASMISRDNTTRQRAHRRLQSVLESAPDAIFVANHNGLIVLVNTQAEILFGYHRDQMVGQPLALLLPRSFQDIFGKWFQQDPGLRLPCSRHEVYGVRADNSEFPAEISLGPVEADDGVLLCGAVRDVSERYALQKAVREKNAQLQAALHAKEHFLATMSHELRTPLTAIIGFIGILLMKISGPLNDAQVRQMELVRSSARHLLAIINDLLDLARIEAGKAQLQCEDIFPLEVVEETVRELHGAAEQKRLQLTISAPLLPIQIQSDRRFLRQILANIVSNAIKFTDQGTVNISFAESGENSSRNISFIVADSGIGIRSEDLSRLFIEFCRVQTDSGSRREGTGLGLHLSQRLALLLGGRITVESEFGRGSTFTLTLPATVPE